MLDVHGNVHFPRVRAAREGVVIQQGETVLVVDRAQSPVIDSLLKEAGFQAGGNPVESLVSATKANGAAVPAVEAPQH